LDKQIKQAALPVRQTTPLLSSESACRKKCKQRASEWFYPVFANPGDDHWLGVNVAALKAH
jgi:hypothetical protein